MKTLKILKYTFTLVGAGMLAGAFASYSSTSDFLQSAGDYRYSED